MQRDRFFLYRKYRRQIETLTTEQKGILLDAIFAYVDDDPLPNMDEITRYAFQVIRIDIDEDTARYNERCRVNAENGKKGGLAKAENLANASERYRTQAKPSESSGYDRYDMTDINKKRNTKEKSRGKKNGFINFPEREYNHAEVKEILAKQKEV